MLGLDLLPLGLLGHENLLLFGTASSCNANALWLVVLRTLQGQRQNTLLQRRVYFVRVHLEGKSEGPNKATPTPLSAVVSPGLVRLILALSAKCYRVAVHCDFQVVVFARQAVRP